MLGFPEGKDFAWLACDNAGHVAMFVNAGSGPIPAAVLADRPEADWTEQLVRGLPRMGGHTLHFRFPVSDDYIRWAEQGLYAYDWRDAGPYQIIATPEVPITVDQLLAEVTRLARLATFGLRFADNPTVDASQVGGVACSVPSRQLP